MNIKKLLRPLHHLSSSPSSSCSLRLIQTLISGGSNKSYTRRQQSTNPDQHVIQGRPLPSVVAGVAIQDYIFESLPKYEDIPLFTCGLSQRFYTGKHIYEMAHSFGAALVHHGVKKGDIICVLLPNLPEYPIVMLGIWLAGGVVSPVSSSSTTDELTRQCSITQCRTIVTMPFFVNLVKSVMPKIPSLKSVIDVDPFDDEVAPNTHSFFEMVKTNWKGVPFFNSQNVDTLNDIAILPFSSGTTGPPKAVMLTHSGLCSNALQYLQPGIGLRESPERYIGLLPFYHCFGFCALALMPMRTGSHVCTLPKFDPLSFVAAIKNHKPTVLNVVTPLVQFIVSFPDIGKKEFASVHTVVSGAAPVGPLLTKALLEKAANNLFFQEGYGMTETTCFTHISREKWKNKKLGSIGTVVPGTQCKVIDLNTSQALPHGMPGELWVKGPQLMKGYYKNESATRDTITSDGWLKTGDVAQYDEDECFYIVDRIKELIKVKGLQVSPSELEDVLRTHPDIADVAVIGVTHHRFGEAPRAFIVKKNDESLSAENIHAFLEGKIAPHKKLAGGIDFIEEIPRAPSGKILRRVLLRKYLEENH